MCSLKPGNILLDQKVHPGVPFPPVTARVADLGGSYHMEEADHLTNVGG